MSLTKRVLLFGLTMMSVAGVTALIPGVCAYADERPGSGMQLLEKKQGVPDIEVQKPKQQQVLTEAKTTHKIFVKKIRIIGNNIFSSEELHKLVAKAEGKELTFDDISTLADMITAKYHDAGYLIANAFVPTQKIIDQSVLIKIVEGKIGEIKVVGNKSYSADFVKRHLSLLKDQEETLEEEALEKQMLILNDYPSLTVKASLKAGKDPGTTDIIADVKDSFPVSGSLFYDNYGEKSTSKNRAVASLNLGNLLLSGDQLMLRGIMGLDTFDFNSSSFGRVEYSIPVGASGARLGAYYTDSIYAAGGVLTPLEINGKADIGGVYVSQPVIKKRDETLTIQLGLDYASIVNNAYNSKNNEDEVRKAVLTASYDSTDRFLGRNFVGFSYSRGLGGLLNGTKNGTSDVSVNGANDTFDKLALDAMRSQKLPGYNDLLARISAQYSPQRIFLAEQFNVGGEGTVRGYDPSKIHGDSGLLGSLELNTSPLFPDAVILKQKVGNSFKLALFTDYAAVFTNNPINGEKADDHLWSVGAGVRLFGGKYFSAKLDWAVPQIGGSFSVKSAMTNIQAGFAF